MGSRCVQSPCFSFSPGGVIFSLRHERRICTSLDDVFVIGARWVLRPLRSSAGNYFRACRDANLVFLRTRSSLSGVHPRSEDLEGFLSAERKTRDALLFLPVGRGKENFYARREIAFTAQRPGLISPVAEKRADFADVVVTDEAIRGTWQSRIFFLPLHFPFFLWSASPPVFSVVLLISSYVTSSRRGKFVGGDDSPKIFIRP